MLRFEKSHRANHLKGENKMPGFTENSEAQSAKATRIDVTDETPTARARAIRAPYAFLKSLPMTRQP